MLSVTFVVTTGVTDRCDCCCIASSTGGSCCCCCLWFCDGSGRGGGSCNEEGCCGKGDTSDGDEGGDNDDDGEDDVEDNGCECNWREEVAHGEGEVDVCRCEKGIGVERVTAVCKDGDVEVLPITAAAADGWFSERWKLEYPAWLRAFLCALLLLDFFR